MSRHLISPISEKMGKKASVLTVLQTLALGDLEEVTTQERKTF